MAIYRESPFNSIKDRTLGSYCGRRSIQAVRAQGDEKQCKCITGIRSGIIMCNFERAYLYKLLPQFPSSFPSRNRWRRSRASLSCVPYIQVGRPAIASRTPAYTPFQISLLLLSLSHRRFTWAAGKYDIEPETKTPNPP